MVNAHDNAKEVEAVTVNETRNDVANVGPELEAGVSDEHQTGQQQSVEEMDRKDTHWYAYFKTRDFYLILLLGYAVKRQICVYELN